MSNKLSVNETYEARYQHFLGETAKIQWQELQPFFARGQIVLVDGQMDLIEVAARVSLDEKACIEQWYEAEKLSRPTDEQAMEWFNQSTCFWAVVTAPWVLIQIETDTKKDADTK